MGRTSCRRVAVVFLLEGSVESSPHTLITQDIVSIVPTFANNVNT